MSQAKYKLVLLISQSDSGHERIVSLLGKSNEYRLIRSLTAVLDPKLFEEHAFTTVIFDCDLLDARQMTTLRRLSERIGTVRILILARQISIHAYRQVGAMENMVALQKPFIDSVFTTVLQGMTSDEPGISMQRFPRFITNQPVRLVVLGTGLLIPTRMRNYSAGGAFIEYNGISLKVGDRLQVNMVEDADTPRPTDAIQLKAKVVWIKEGNGTRDSVRGVGIQFLSA